MNTEAARGAQSCRVAFFLTRVKSEVGRAKCVKARVKGEGGRVKWMSRDGICRNVRLSLHGG